MKQNNYINQFLKKGYFIARLNKEEFKEVSQKKKNILKIFFIKKKKINLKQNPFFEDFHKFIKYKDINRHRLFIFNQLNKNEFNKKYYKIISRIIEPIVGNENVIQKKINLSIQLPNDETSILPVHSDTWAGDSPFEVVIWIPLVNCKKTQSMFILPKNTKIFDNFKKYKFTKNSQIMKKIKKDIKFINIKYGEILVFSQNLPHGNTLNLESKTRWSFNARVKSLMTPYEKKGLLDFFDIIKLNPVTKLGLEYENPKFK